MASKHEKVLKVLSVIRETSNADFFRENPLGLHLILANIFPEDNVSYEIVFIGMDATIMTVIKEKFYTIDGEAIVVNNVDLPTAQA